MSELTWRLMRGRSFLRMQCAAIVAIAWHCVLGKASAQTFPADHPRTGNESIFTADGKVILRGQQLEIMPAELLSARGMEPPDIPIEQNAAWKLVEALNQMKDCPAELDDAFFRASGGDWPEGEVGVHLRSWLNENARAIATAREAAASSQYYMPFFRGDSDMMIAALLPTLGHSRQLARIMAAEATYQLANGDAAAAIDQFLTIHRMGNQIGNGQTLIEGLVGMACGALADDGILRVVASGHADSETLKAALAEMNELQATFPRFEPMLRAEQKWSNSLVDDLIDYGGWGMVMAGGEDPSPGLAERNGWSRLRAAVQRIYLPDRAVKRNINTFFDTMAESARSEDGTSGNIVDEELLFRKMPAWDKLTRMMLPSIAHAHSLTLRAESNFIRTKLSMAAEAYRKEKGVYPASLGELVPQYLADVPYDPMTGQDFDYAPPTKSGERPSGISKIGRDDEGMLMKKRRMPAILSPRASKWRRYVISFADRHEFSDSQRSAAESILRDVESRAAAFEQTQGQRLRDVIDTGDEAAAKAGVGPLDELFSELKRRLETLPTAGQREKLKSRSDADRK